MLELVGEGGMARVYRGVDRVLSRPVAIKLMLPHMSEKESARIRFQREARAVALLKDPNIVEIYDFSGPDSKQSFIVAEFVDGPSLSELLEGRKAFLPELAAAIVWVVSKALAHAHSKGVVHRDIKPENVLVTSTGHLKLTDFGVAYIIGQSRLTATKAMVGSPAHMSPEQVMGEPIDHRSDIFSLGTMLFLLATGKYPYDAESDVAIIRQIAEAAPPDPYSCLPSFPQELAIIISRMMARDPDQRFQTMQDVTSALDVFLTDVGIDDIEDVVARGITKGDEFCRDFARQLSQVYAKKAGVLIEHGRPAQAIKLADRALVLDPKNREARDLVRATSRRQGINRILILFLLILLIGIPVGYHIWPGPVIRKSFISAFFIPVRAPEAEFIVQKRRNATFVPEYHRPQLVNRLVPVEVRAFPPAVRIAIDGRKYGFGSTGRIRLRPGLHRVLLIHPNCPVCAKTIRRFRLSLIHPPKEALRFSVAYRPANLFVKYPKSSVVLINNKPVGYTNRSISWPIASPKGQVVHVMVKGCPQKQKIRLFPGKTSRISLNK